MVVLRCRVLTITTRKTRIRVTVVGRARRVLCVWLVSQNPRYGGWFRPYLRILLTQSRIGRDALPPCSGIKQGLLALVGRRPTLMSGTLTYHVTASCSAEHIRGKATRQSKIPNLTAVACCKLRQSNPKREHVTYILHHQPSYPVQLSGGRQTPSWRRRLTGTF